MEELRNLAEAEAQAAAKIRNALAPTNDQLVLTLTTRIGSVLLLLFFAKILVSIFRYYVRLSMFYQSRADTLSLQHVDLNLTLTEIATLFSTESIDFEKSSEPNASAILAAIKELKSLYGKGGAAKGDA